MKQLFAPSRLAFAMLAVALSSAPMSAHAVATDALIEGAKQCTRLIPRYERQYGIPVHLLSAISSTESGRYHKGLKISVPWPWTINAEGKGYYLDSKQEAINMAKRLRASGVKSMDVGCMQVNLMHHPNAFASIEEAFEPEMNVAYAAKFLRSLYDEQQNWKQAASSYHSRTPSFGNQYVSRVYDSWYNIINRVRSAREIASQSTSLAASKGTQGLASAAQLASASAAAAFATSSDQPAPKAPPARRAAAPATQQAAYTGSPSMKIIQIKSVPNEPKRAEPLVIHPAPAVPAAPAAQVSVTPPQVTTAAAPEPRVLEVADAGKVQIPAILRPMAADQAVYPQDRGDVVSGHRNGPRFIFNQ